MCPSFVFVLQKVWLAKIYQLGSSNYDLYQCTYEYLKQQPYIFILFIIIIAVAIAAANVSVHCLTNFLKSTEP